MFPATLFDFNGILVDDELVHLEAFRDSVRPLGIEISEADYFERYLGLDDAGGFEALLTGAGLPATTEEVARLIAAKRPLYMERARAGLETFPGAADVVRQQAKAGPVAVVSGALTAEIEFGLQYLGVRELVEHIVSAEDTKVSKPDPEGYRMGVEWLTQRIGESANRALVIEDSLDGIAAAKAIRLPCVAVTHSYPRERLEASGADWVVDTLAEITPAGLAALHRKLYE